MSVADLSLHDTSTAVRTPSRRQDEEVIMDNCLRGKLSNKSAVDDEFPEKGYGTAIQATSAESVGIPANPPDSMEDRLRIRNYPLIGNSRNVQSGRNFACSCRGKLTFNLGEEMEEIGDLSHEMRGKWKKVGQAVGEGWIFTARIEGSEAPSSSSVTGSPVVPGTSYVDRSDGHRQGRSPPRSNGRHRPRRI